MKNEKEIKVEKFILVSFNRCENIDSLTFDFRFII